MRHHAATPLEEGSGVEAEAARNCARNAASSNDSSGADRDSSTGVSTASFDDRLGQDGHRRGDRRRGLRLGGDGTE